MMTVELPLAIGHTFLNPTFVVVVQLVVSVGLFGPLQVQRQVLAALDVHVSPYVHKISVLTVDGERHKETGSRLHWPEAGFMLPALLLRRRTDAQRPDSTPIVARLIC